MLKKIIVIAAAVLLIVSLTGCSRSNNAANTPAPTANLAANSTPMAQGDAGMTGEGMTGEGAGMTGNASGEGDTAGTGQPSNPEPTTGAGGVGSPYGSTDIENFKEGTQIEPTDAPEVQKAIEGKYAGATIKTIKHAVYQGSHVYEVEIDNSGKTSTVYVSADGSNVTEKGA